MSCLDLAIGKVQLELSPGPSGPAQVAQPKRPGPSNPRMKNNCRCWPGEPSSAFKAFSSLAIAWISLPSPSRSALQGGPFKSLVRPQNSLVSLRNSLVNYNTSGPIVRVPLFSTHVFCNTPVPSPVLVSSWHPPGSLLCPPGVLLSHSWLSWLLLSCSWHHPGSLLAVLATPCPMLVLLESIWFFLAPAGPP